MRPYINNEDRWKPSKKYIENTHHIVARFEGGTNHPDNKLKIYMPVHEAYHRLLGTEKIRWALLQILKINSKAIKNTQFELDILKVLEETDDEYYYKDGVYHKR
jgi:hypothetical protein